MAGTLCRVPEVDKRELARQVVVNVGAGLAAGYAGPMAGTLAQGAAPLVLAGMDWFSATIGKRRIEHATETVMYAAEEFGAETPEDFVEFVKKAVCDEEHQELLARSLTIAQDTAMRDKRRALGRALASAASDIGTKVDEELIFVRVLADLDEPHIRLLRLLSTEPPEVAVQPGVFQRSLQSIDAERGWYPSLITQVDPGWLIQLGRCWPRCRDTGWHRIRLAPIQHRSGHRSCITRSLRTDSGS